MDNLPKTKQELDQAILQGIETFMRNKQFNLSKIQAHEHNGVDTVRISQKNVIKNMKVTSFLQDIGATTYDVINNISNVNSVYFSGFAANNAAPGTVVFTSGSATVNGTGTTFYAGMVGQYLSVPPLGNFPIASYISPTQITINIPYPGASTGSVAYTIPATKRAIINGHAEFGVCEGYSDTTSLIPLTQNIIQMCNSMYVDSTDLTKNRVAATNGDLVVQGNPFGYFCYVRDDTGAVLVTTVISYTNKTITFKTILSPGWTLQGPIIIN